MNQSLEDILSRIQHDPALTKGILSSLKSRIEKPLKVMEVCGTHTHAISKTGIRKALSGRIKLLSGPGCPVCVTSDAEIDRFIQLSYIKNTVITTFGDMLHVPGSLTSLAARRDQGADIRIVYSPLDVLNMASSEPDKEFCFLGVGFETTSPTILATIVQARKKNIKNFSVYASFKIIPPALRLIASHPELEIDGFLLPGHVSAIIGTEPYQFLAEEFDCPSVVAGFEGADILQALSMIADQIETRTPRVEIQYSRVVTPQGNQAALDLIDQMCVVKDICWRGLGVIPETGLKLEDEWADFDAERKLHIPEIVESSSVAPKGCRCGEILLGKIVPPDCPLFAESCTPEHPVGPCMVSSEGACAAYYKYER